MRHVHCVCARRPRLGWMIGLIVVGAWPCAVLLRTSPPGACAPSRLCARTSCSITTARAVAHVCRPSCSTCKQRVRLCTRVDESSTAQGGSSSTRACTSTRRAPVRLYSRTARTNTHATAVRGQRRLCGGQMPLGCHLPVRAINHVQAPSTTQCAPRRRAGCRSGRDECEPCGTDCCHAPMLPPACTRAATSCPHARTHANKNARVVDRQLIRPAVQSSRVPMVIGQHCCQAHASVCVHGSCVRCLQVQGASALAVLCVSLRALLVLQQDVLDAAGHAAYVAKRLLLRRSPESKGTHVMRCVCGWTGAMTPSGSLSTWTCVAHVPGHCSCGPNREHSRQRCARRAYVSFSRALV